MHLPMLVIWLTSSSFFILTCQGDNETKCVQLSHCAAEYCFHLRKTSDTHRLNTHDQALEMFKWNAVVSEKLVNR